MAGTRRGIFNSNDGGITWSEDNEGLTEKRVFTLAQVRNEVYAGTEDGIYEKSEPEASWFPLKTGDRKLPSIFSLAYNSPNLFAGTRSGLYRITLGSEQEEPKLELEKSVPQDSFVSDLRVIDHEVYASTNQGLYRLSDRSNSWSKELVGDGDVSYHGVTSSEQGIFVSTSKGLYRKGPGETVWRLMEGDRASNSSYAVVADGTLFNETSDGIFCDDLRGGPTAWVQCDEGVGNQAIQTFAVLPVGVFAGTQGGIFKWNAATKRWIESDTNLSRAQTIEVVSTTGPEGIVIFVVATQFDQSDEDSAIYRSQDLGKSWTLISGKLAFGWTDSLLALNNKLYTTKAGNVYVSNDLGSTWTPDNEGLMKDEEVEAEFSTHLAAIGDTLFLIGNGKIQSRAKNESKWQLVSGLEGLGEETIDIVGQPGRIFLLTSRSLYQSSNGQSWNRVGDTPVFRPHILQYTPDALYVAGGRNSFIWKLPLTANSQWEKLTLNNVSGLIHTLWMDQAFPKVMVVGTKEGLFWTNNSGNSFQKWESCGQNVSFRDVLSFSSDAGHSIIATDQGVFYLVDQIPREYFYQYVWHIVEDRWEIFSGVLVGLVLMVVLSTRLILLLLQLDFGPVKKLAKAVYITPFGKWKLYRQYRKNIRNNREIQTATNTYVDLPYQQDGLDSSEKLSESLFDILTKQPVVVIAGGGLGKSTLCRYVANKAASDKGAFHGKKREPVIVEGAAYGGNMLDSVKSSLLERQAYVNSEIVESQLLAGNLLIIFDGFSEIRDAVKTSGRLDDVAKFVQDYPDTVFLFTSRSELTVEVQQALSAAANISLKEVDEANLPIFLGKYLKHGAAEAPKVIAELRQRLPELPRVPLLLSLIAILYQRTEAIPKDEVALYSDYANQLLRRQATGIDEPAGLTFALRQLVRESFIKSGGDRGFTQDKGIEYLAHIKSPLEDRDLKLSPIALLRTLSRAGLLRESTEYYRFFHDYFEDYFAARALENDLLNGNYDLVKEAFLTHKLDKTLGFLKLMSVGAMYESKLVMLEGANSKPPQ